MIQKSINGFNRQLNDLIEGKFTEDDLENAKKTMKARYLDNEGTMEKLRNLKKGLNSKEGILRLNKAYELIDTITKDDIVAFAKKATQNAPIYSITATQDTLDYNKEFLDSLQ